MEFLNYITWNVDKELVNIGGLSIRYYGLLFVTGLILSIKMLEYLYNIAQKDKKLVQKLTGYTIVGIILGARLGHCLFYEPAYYLSHPIEMILPVRFTDEGMKFIGYQGLASHGGALGMIIALLFYIKKTKESLLQTIDYVAIVAPIGCFFIRMANLMNSEIIGNTTEVPWAFIFVQVDNNPRHPSQLYEAISYLILALVMMYLFFKRRETMVKGQYFGVLLTVLFAARFFIEFTKEEQVSFEEGMALNMGQLLSIPYILAGVFFMIRPKLAKPKVNKA